MRKYVLDIYVSLSLIILPLVTCIYFGLNLTPLIHISEKTAIVGANLWSEPVYYLKNGGYDGQYYYLESIDIKNELKYVPPGYYVRILMPAIVYLATTLTGVFSTSVILFGLNFLYLLLAWILVKKVYQINGTEKIYQTLFINVGILTAYKYGLTEPLATLFLILAIYIYEFFIQRKYGIALFVVSLALVLIARDAFVYAILGMFIYFLFTKKLKLATGTAFSVAIFLFFKKFLLGAGGSEPLTLFMLNSFPAHVLPLLNEGSSGLINFTLSCFFMFWLIVVAVVLFRKTKIFLNSNIYVFMCLTAILFLGFFNPTSAWTNISGVGRHLACLFPFLPIALTSARINSLTKKIIISGNVVFTVIFYLWFFKSLLQKFYILYPQG